MVPPHTKHNINKIEMTQLRAARWVKNQFFQYESVTNMLSELGWRSLEDRRIDARLIMFYKIVHGYYGVSRNIIPLYNTFEEILIEWF